MWFNIFNPWAWLYSIPTAPIAENQATDDEDLPEDFDDIVEDFEETAE